MFFHFLLKRVSKCVAEILNFPSEFSVIKEPTVAQKAFSVLPNFLRVSAYRQVQKIGNTDLC